MVSTIQVEILIAQLAIKHVLIWHQVKSCYSSQWLTVIVSWKKYI